VRFQGGEQGIDTDDETVVHDAFVLERLDLVSTSVARLVDLSLFRANEGTFVDVGVNLDV
jgi:hypothetical protein